MKKIRNGIMSAVASGVSIASLGGMTSCSKPMYSNVIHIAPYLHEITYDDYREDTKYETIDEAEAFGCSSARNGNFYGRNFDYIYNDTPEFIVHVKANEEKKRHASLAVATHFGLRENKMLQGSYHKQLELIPNLTMDGINDHGVICSANVVSLEPKHDDIIPETSPDNPNAKNVHMLFLVRFVLDNADSVEDAINKLRSPDINVMGNLNEKNFLHIMIADKTSTAIVEFYKKADSNHNHFDVVPRLITGNEKPIMTNFYRNTETIRSDFTNNEKSGYERDKILKYYYDLSDNFLGMQALLKKVQFSQAYEFGHNPVFTDGTSTDGKAGDLNSEWYSEKGN
ncbi:MAG: carcinine hydrolase/isopenicillin-N N-acyltransferase family protein [Mycoplasmoidaceae bacterium]|nr:carcinine hydrolase/isopenicillin-N N-acyltransferase family protein [Mycoplasmoidaceae bacterium]